MDNDTNICHINIIEGLVSEIHNHLEAIIPQTAKINNPVEQAEIKDEARTKLASWERNELYGLRREFEK